MPAIPPSADAHALLRYATRSPTLLPGTSSTLAPPGHWSHTSATIRFVASLPGSTASIDDGAPTRRPQARTPPYRAPFKRCTLGANEGILMIADFSAAPIIVAGRNPGGFPARVFAASEFQLPRMDNQCRTSTLGATREDTQENRDSLGSGSSAQRAPF